MDNLLERKRDLLREHRARMDAIKAEHDSEMAERLADVIDTAMEESETMSVEEFRKRLREDG